MQQATVPTQGHPAASTGRRGQDRVPSNASASNSAPKVCGVADVSRWTSQGHAKRSGVRVTSNSSLGLFGAGTAVLPRSYRRLEVASIAGASLASAKRKVSVPSAVGDHHGFICFFGSFLSLHLVFINADGSLLRLLEEGVGPTATHAPAPPKTQALNQHQVSVCDEIAFAIVLAITDAMSPQSKQGCVSKSMLLFFFIVAAPCDQDFAPNNTAPRLSADIRHFTELRSRSRKRSKKLPI